MKSITPNWPISKKIRAFTTCRQKGSSQGAFSSFNLSFGAGDDPDAVTANRALLKGHFGLPADPLWLEQTHSSKAIDAAKIAPDHLSKGNHLQADAIYTQKNNQVCVVMTADCVPILVANHQASEVAAIHAGWRGIAAGVIENTIQAMYSQPQDLVAWLGPAISAAVYEVGDDVKDQLIAADPKAEIAFSPSPQKRWMADLYTLASHRLNKAGVTNICCSHLCTYTEENSFYSYRRDQLTGRMASLIWIEN